MRTLLIIPLVLMSLVSFPSWGLDFQDLVAREGLWYKKFTSTPFTGEVDEGLWRGSLKNGNMDGSSETYHENGQLFSKGDWKNGEQEGYWESFHEDGQLWSKGNFKNGKKEGYWVRYNEDRSVNKFTGTYKNGVKVSD